MVTLRPNGPDRGEPARRSGPVGRFFSAREFSSRHGPAAGSIVLPVKPATTAQPSPLNANAPMAKPRGVLETRPTPLDANPPSGPTRIAANVAEQLRKYRAESHSKRKAETVRQFDALEQYSLIRPGLSHRAALKEFDRVKREASASGERVTGCWLKVA